MAQESTVRPIRTRNRQTGGSPTRTTRIGDDVWKRAKARASKDGVSMSQLMNMLVEGYSEEKISLPRVELVYGEKS